MALWALREDWQCRRLSTRPIGHEGGTDSANRLKLMQQAARSEFDPRLLEEGRVPRHLLMAPLKALGMAEVSQSSPLL